MQLIINHLTRLKPGYICVAGLNPENGQHVRPVIRFNLLSTAFLVERPGCYFAIGHRVDLGPVKYAGSAPELEDYNFEPGRARHQDKLAPTEFWQLLVQSARPTLRDLFGSDLQPHPHNKQHAVVAEHTGQHSLGNLQPALKPHLTVDELDKLRLHLNDGQFDLNLAVTDLRFYQSDLKTLKKEVVAQAQEWLEAAPSVVVSVGLSRAWKKEGDSVARHWLQANNLHFEQQPIW